MTDHIQEYIARVEYLFPVMGKPERRYLKNLASDITDFFHGTHPFSYEAVVAQFGEPEEVLERYIESADEGYLLSRIRQAAAYRRIFTLLVVLVCIVSVIVLMKLGQEYCALEKLLSEINGYYIVSIE